MPEFFWPRGFAARLVRAALLLSICMAATSARAQNASIGLYSDASGNSCSFSGDAPGYVTAYVVVRPDPRGVTAVQFAAPLPACYGATYLYDQAASAALVLGNSQTGVSVALSQCVDDPVNVLQIVYYQTGGATASCCPYPIIPDPALGTLSASDCAFQDLPIAGVTSHMNADASCQCAGNSAPSMASNPIPQDLTSGISRTPIMSWYASDIDGNLSEYDIYLGTTPSPPLVASGLPSANYFSPQLAANTLHYWRVVARDEQGLETSGPTWTFATRASGGNSPPYIVDSPQPPDFENNVILSPTLTWVGEDPDGDAVGFDVYFGTSDPPPLVSDNQTAMTYSPGPLATATEYFWRIVVTDGLNVVSGPTWRFTTRSFANRPPNPPTSPTPPDGSVDHPFAGLTLTWGGSDPDGDALRYDVYFGTTTPPPLVSDNLSAGVFPTGLLALGTTYYWYVVARDPAGLTTAGPIWSFQTRLFNAAPSVPAFPTPPDGGTIPVPAGLGTVHWVGSDPDADPVSYDLYFGTVAPLTLIATGLTTSHGVMPGGLAPLTTYLWKVVASDGLLTTDGPTWSFTTLPAPGKGDVNGDNSITLDDASCALGGYVYGGSGCPGYSAQRADVDCNASVTPRDARCIHKHVLDGSCAFCVGASAASAVEIDHAAVLVPTLYVGTTYSEGQFVVAPVFVSGVASLEALGFQLDLSGNAVFQGAVNAGATIGFARLQSLAIPFPGFFGRVGGYSLSGAPAENFVLMLLLYFDLTDDRAGTATISSCIDDLAGAEPVTFIIVPSAPPTPVLISRFEAVRSGSDVEVRWDYASDEPIAGYTVYRHDVGAAKPVAIVEGVDVGTRSYVDRAVLPGTTYHYELVVRTQAGGEFRSQSVTVTTAQVALALGQNHPNPFNPQTTIPFDIPAPARVRLLVMDAAGRMVRKLVDENVPAGAHNAVWDGRDGGGRSVSSGVYFYVLDVGGERLTRKMVLLK